MNRFIISALLASLSLLSGCADDIAAPEPVGNTADVTPSSCAIEGVPCVVGAYIRRIDLAHGGTALTDPLLDAARSAADSPALEQRRELHAATHLVTGYLPLFTRVAGIDDAAWAPAAQPGQLLSPTEVHQAGLRALLLAQERLAARPVAPWVEAYRAFAAANVAKVHAGTTDQPVSWYVPSAWYGSVDVFQAAWMSALEAGYDAGAAAWDAAPKDTPEQQQVAAGAAIQAVLGAHADTYATIQTTTLEELRALIEMR